MFHCFRLTYGCDLKKAIEEYCLDQGIGAAAMVSGVGCLYKAVIRMADGVSIVSKENRYEIVSLIGTISKDGAHLHISLSDCEGNVIGGHLCYGSLVNTTCEIVLVALDEQYEFTRKYDENTGYKELVISKKED